ncbi:potassium channel family protein [Geoanaerobacter pelophilus]|uniref:potassium channel family protein n=1 Tax=Geoanaerobacter pelophilus TaxID=60036 RepID=UPI00117A7659|nr:potassium channel family protein [Geoanaerobacter pelophilus]
MKLTPKNGISFSHMTSFLLGGLCGLLIFSREREPVATEISSEGRDTTQSAICSPQHSKSADPTNEKELGLGACLAVLLSAFISIAVSITYPSKLNGFFNILYWDQIKTWQMIYFITPFAILVSAVSAGTYLCFKDSYKGYLLQIIVSTYVATIINFGCCQFNYYAMSNYNDLQSAHAYYQRLECFRKNNPNVNIQLRKENLLSLKGVERLWTENIKQEGNSDLVHVDDKTLVDTYVTLSKKRLPDTIEFRQERVPHILFECIYFSVTTICTVGYGDIVPTSKLSKSIVMVESLLGQLLLVVAVGRVFARSWEKKQELGTPKGAGTI